MITRQGRRDDGMRFLAQVFDRELRQLQERAVAMSVGRPRMHHHRHRDIVAPPGLQHEHFNHCQLPRWKSPL